MQDSKRQTSSVKPISNAGGFFAAGFTLIELLVVLVLLGLMSSIALMTLGGGNQTREMMNEVNRLHAVLRLAADEAIYSNEEIGVALESDSYEFLVWDEQESQWNNSDKQALRSRTLPSWLTMDFQREGKERKILGSTEDKEFYGNTETLDIEKSSKKPDFMLLSSGEVGRFIIGFQIDDDGDSRVEIKATEQGEIIIPSLQQEEDG
jgi:general secretion pathway protein H